MGNLNILKLPEMIYDIKYQVSHNPAKAMDNRTQWNYNQVDKHIY